MQRTEWLELEQEARATKPQTASERQTLNVTILLAGLVEEIHLLRMAIEARK